MKYSLPCMYYEIIYIYIFTDFVSDPGQESDTCGTGFPACGASLKCNTTNNDCVKGINLRNYCIYIENIVNNTYYSLLYIYMVFVHNPETIFYACSDSSYKLRRILKFHCTFS